MFAVSQTWERYRFSYFSWRTHLGLLQMLLLALAMACLTGLVAQLKFYLPFTPVPVTGQTFAVLLAGVLLGKNWGGLSQVFYVGMGLSGIPWFAGKVGGLAVMAGPTGGYLVGFVLAAFFLGYMTDTFVKVRRFRSMFVLMLVATFALIFIPGLIQLSLWLNLSQGKSFDLNQVLTLGLWPFVPGAFIKCALAAFLTTVITPKRSYAREFDS